jgi:hypothetical protein
MKRISTILVLLLAIGLVAVCTLPPAAHAVQNSGSQSGIAGTSVSNTTTAGTSGTTTGGDGEQGDPGGAGDGLGADPELHTGASSLDSGVEAVVELVKQLLLLLQVAS